MEEVGALIFIDANQYLDLYRVVEGKQLLGLLEEQRNYIFVPVQVVEEVERNKLQVAASFLEAQFKPLEIRGLEIPDHLFDISGEITAKLRKKLQGVRRKIEELNADLTKAAVQTLQRISRSEDEISKALADLFGKAISPTPEEIQRARGRRERGNPPGKKSDPLGDQLTWEQLLSHCQGKSRLWIISKDHDYYVAHSGKAFLNPLLYQDLRRRPPLIEQVFCFKNLADGLKHFVKTAKVTAKKLPPPKVLQEIKEEQDSLPPLDWLSSPPRPIWPELNMRGANAPSNPTWNQLRYPGAFVSGIPRMIDRSWFFPGVPQDADQPEK